MTLNWNVWVPTPSGNVYGSGESARDALKSLREQLKDAAEQADAAAADVHRSINLALAEMDTLP